MDDKSDSDDDYEKVMPDEKLKGLFRNPEKHFENWSREAEHL